MARPARDQPRAPHLCCSVRRADLLPAATPPGGPAFIAFRTGSEERVAACARNPWQSMERWPVGRLRLLLGRNTSARGFSGSYVCVCRCRYGSSALSAGRAPKLRGSRASRSTKVDHQLRPPPAPRLQQRGPRRAGCLARSGRWFGRWSAPDAGHERVPVGGGDGLLACPVSLKEVLEPAIAARPVPIRNQRKVANALVSWVTSGRAK